MTAHTLALSQLRIAAAVALNVSMALLANLFVVVLATFGGCVAPSSHFRVEAGLPSSGTVTTEPSRCSASRESPNVVLKRHSLEGGLNACVGTSPAEDGRGVYYRFIGRLFEASLHIDEQCICPDAETAMVTFESVVGAAGSDDLCGSKGVGIAELPERLPAELGAWLAIVDLYGTIDGGRREPQLGDSRSGFPTVQSQNKILDDGAEGHMASSCARHVCQFEPGPGIACVAQLKTYLTSSLAPEPHPHAGGIPGAKAGPGWQQQQERWGLRWREGGTFYWDQVSRHADGRVVYEMRLSFQAEMEASDGSGRIVGQTVVCRSNSPVFFSMLQDFEVREQALPNDNRRICVGRKEH